MQQQKIQTCKN